MRQNKKQQWPGALTTPSLTRAVILSESLPPSTAMPSSCITSHIAVQASCSRAPSPGSLAAHIQLPLHFTSCITKAQHSSAHSVRVALNNSFRRIFNCCWQQNPKTLLFYCGTLPALYTGDQRRILFYMKLKHHSSILIRTIARLCQHDILSVAAKYGIYRSDNLVSFIKKPVWKTFAASAV